MIEKNKYYWYNKKELKNTFQKNIYRFDVEKESAHIVNKKGINQFKYNIIDYMSKL